MPASPRLEAQLDLLLAHGIHLGPETTRDDVLDDVVAEWSAEAFADDPFRKLMIALGSPDARHARNLWHFDTECIEDHGAYAAIAERFAELAEGDLPLTDVEDSVDLEEGQASLSFTLDGQRIEWECAVDDDWVDATVLSRFAALLAQRKTGRRFTYLDLEGQDFIVGCLTDSQRASLSAATGLTIEWLE
jgi:hypothetical protein